MELWEMFHRKSAIEGKAEKDGFIVEIQPLTYQHFIEKFRQVFVKKCADFDSVIRLIQKICPNKLWAFFM